VFRNRGIVAAAAGAVAAGVFLTALAPGAGGESTATSVTLQIAPRGLGSVSASPPGLNSDNQLESECTQNIAQHSCEWRYAPGTTVTLTAKPDVASGRSLASWSTADCPSATTCTTVLDDDLTSIVALFTPLRLAVRLTSAQTNPGTVTMDPPGAACRGTLHDASHTYCSEFPARTRVTLTVQENAPHTFKEWSQGCEPVAPRSCAITVLDEATWVAAAFDNDQLPTLPTTIRVQFRLRKLGSGSGRVTASNLDCGSQCGAQYGYGTSLTLTAVPDGGSVFDGWNDRVCAPMRTSCTVPVGPITAITTRFARPPNAPASLRVTKRTRTNITVTWSASTGGARVTEYRMYVNGVAKGRTAKTSFSLRGLGCGRRYGIAVDAVDAGGHSSSKTSTSARTAPCALRAQLVAVRVKLAGGLRTILVGVRVDRPATVRVSLHARRVAARRQYRVRQGKRVLGLPVPRGLPAGRYGLRVTLTARNAATLTLRSRVVLPSG
jgi:Divergent InlB B-repeat domain